MRRGGTYAAVLGPGGDAVGVDGDALLEALDRVLVLEEEDSTVGVREAANPLLRRRELLCGDDLLENVQSDVPKLLVLGAQEEDSL